MFSRDGFFKQTFLKVNIGNIAIRFGKCKGHYFHQDCILEMMKHETGKCIKCPVDSIKYGVYTGKMPHGTMRTSVSNSMHCSGF